MDPENQGLIKRFAEEFGAEDLVLVQRDIGRLAQYTAEMGATADLLDLALRIPPWEPMHALTRNELKRTRLTTEDIDAPAAATVAASSPTMVSQSSEALFRRRQSIERKLWLSAICADLA